MTGKSLTEIRAHFTQRSFAWILICSIGVSFSFCEHTWDYSTLKSFQLDSDDAEAQLEKGSLIRRAMIAGLGLVGLCLVLLPGKYKISLDSSLGVLVVTFYSYALLSIFWSDAPERTMRRLAAIILVLTAAMAVVRHLSMRDLILATALIATSFVVIGIAAELVHGTFTPWNLSYRFSGTAHPNTQGAYCAFSSIACIYAWRTSKSRLSFGWLIIGVIACVFLVLTKSRSNLLGFWFGFGLCWYITTTHPRRVLATFGFPLAAAVGLLLATFLGVGVVDKIDEAASGVGRGETSVLTLSGRVPLWGNLIGRAAQRPLLGYGYDGFWTPERIGQVSFEEGWTVPSAHSVPLEIQLSLGLVGLCIFSAIIALATWRCTVELVMQKQLIYGFPFCLIAFGFMSGVFESGFAQPSSFDSFIAACSIALVAFRRNDSEEKDHSKNRSTTKRHRQASSSRTLEVPAAWKTESWKVDEYSGSKPKQEPSWANDDSDWELGKP